MPTINLLKGVNGYLEEKAKKNDRDYTYFHASSWDFCRARDEGDTPGMYKHHRQVAYSVYEAHKYIQIDPKLVKINPGLERIFDNGHWAHDRWRHYLENTAPGALWGRWMCKNPIHKEPKVYGADKKLGCPKPDVCECGQNMLAYQEVGFSDKETLWGGHVDAIIDARRWPYKKGVAKEEKDPQSFFVVVDFKTMNPFSFKALEEPKPEHKTQMQIYLYLSGLKLGKFVYENKADQTVKEFVVDFDEELMEKKRQEAIFMNHLVNHTNSKGNHVLPKRGFEEKDNKTCLQCKFKEHCWA